ncbi:hypothetical protein OGATHE_006477 [Ogataea polymorpha]|uniref:Uncharacterized protein n=1 Tax=Ogataea polymorpha TaxID=460523 RepID=A0A9P8NT89_9ASCO|nr:hypothetical protein OGATHE_006477 [Ogataea polymorpha]
MPASAVVALLFKVVLVSSMSLTELSPAISFFQELLHSAMTSSAYFLFLHSPEKANWFSGFPSGILSQWVVDVDDDHLPVGLALVKESHHTQNLDLLDLARGSDFLQVGGSSMAVARQRVLLRTSAVLRELRGIRAVSDKVSLALFLDLTQTLVAHWICTRNSSVGLFHSSDWNGVKKRLKLPFAIEMGSNGNGQHECLQNHTWPVLWHDKQGNQTELGKVQANKDFEQGQRVVAASVVNIAIENVVQVVKVCNVNERVGDASEGNNNRRDD